LDLQVMRSMRREEMRREEERWLRLCVDAS
jgi:hypothetical protein